tara:strand:- start:576 stop:1325 length:750 start_codon:yes stop_codon:yes gene_type:complete
MMFSRAEERKSDLRNTTVMEVIVAVIVVLLFVIYFKDSKFKEQTAFYAAEVSRLEVLLKEESNRVKELRRENSDLKEKIEGLAAQVARLKKLIGSKGGATTSDLLKEIDRLENKLKFAEAEINKLKSEIKRLQDPVDGKGGKDKPRCRISFGEVQYLADIYWRNGQYRFITDGSDSVVKAKEDEIPGVKELADAGWLSPSTFRKWATVVDNWGDNQTPQCIFYVRIHLADKMSAKDVTLIERYFYKLVV